ncbi:Aldehyde dehydrogenase, thermostable [groundwater metagenome]|uniref:Aldehyde dehydrogenase, thermostable n=1 Tax=groundwater metagenome TaxID=717931 RepID=A0A098EE29_9ZZZZ
MEKYYNLINGKLVEPSTNKYFENINPANRTDVIGLFPMSSPEDINIAVDAARNALVLWAGMTPPKKGRLIFEAGRLLIENKEKLAKVIVREMGKTMPEALGDIQSSADVAYFMAGEGRRLYGQTTFSELDKRWALTKRIPVGVCGLITAWNAPMAIITWKLFPALICGNTVVLKPSEDTPLTAHLLGEILKKAGFPDGVINIVYGIGPETGKALVENNDVELISFTGSTSVGKAISTECGKKLKKCSLELGGKNGLIVMDDANIDVAVQAVASGAFSTAGQRCASTSRVFVHTNVYDEFMVKLVKKTKEMKVGIGSDPDTKICPIINEKQLKRIKNYVDEAQKNGAKLILGGNVLTEGFYGKGNFIEPTIFTDVDIESRLAQEEIFGPVLVVFKVYSLDEGIKMLNDVSYGLTASIFTSRINDAMFALDLIQTGVCYINAPTFGSEVHMPFGGLKNSGNGNREPGTQAMDVFSEWKTIYIDYSDTSQNSQFREKSCICK